MGRDFIDPVGRDCSGLGILLVPKLKPGREGWVSAVLWKWTGPRGHIPTLRCMEGTWVKLWEIRGDVEIRGYEFASSSISIALNSQKFRIGEHRGGVGSLRVAKVSLQQHTTTMKAMFCYITSHNYFDVVCLSYVNILVVSQDLWEIIKCILIFVCFVF